MNRLRVLLTGSEGFIGKNILDELGNKHIFINPTHKELDLTDTGAVDKFFRQHKKFDVIIHCAFIGGPRKSSDTADTFLDNLKIFFNIIHNKKHFKRIINIGSGAEYGKQEPIVEIKESDFDKIVPLNSDYYGLAKYIIAKYIENSDYCVNLRFFGVFGKYESTNLRFISNAICKSILKMPITIKKNVYFEYTSIKDCVNILNYFLVNKTKYRSYNVGRGVKIDLVTIANMINKVSGQESNVKIKNHGLANEYTCNNHRLVREIKNIKFTNFEESVSELYNWYSLQKKRLRKEDFIQDL